MNPIPSTDPRPLCFACGGVVVPQDGDSGLCAHCGPVTFTGTPGDIDLTRPSPPRYLPDCIPDAAEGLPCMDCGAMAPVVAHYIADALCPNCGLVGHAVGSRDGEPFEAVCAATYRYRLERLHAPPPLLDLSDDDDLPF